MKTKSVIALLALLTIIAQSKIAFGKMTVEEFSQKAPFAGIKGIYVFVDVGESKDVIKRHGINVAGINNHP